LQYGGSRAPDVRSATTDKMQKGPIIATLSILVLITTVVVAAWNSNGMTHSEIEAMTGLACMYCNEGDYDRAIQLYHEVMKKSGNSPFVRIGLAAAFFEKGNFEKAEKQYRILLETDKNSPIVIYNLGQTLYRQGRLKEARRYFTRFLEEYGDLLSGLAEKVHALMNDPS